MDRMELSWSSFSSLAAKALMENANAMTSEKNVFRDFDFIGCLVHQVLFFFLDTLLFGFLLELLFVSLFSLCNLCFGLFDAFLYVLVVSGFVLRNRKVFPGGLELVEVRVGVRNEEEDFFSTLGLGIGLRSFGLKKTPRI